MNQAHEIAEKIEHAAHDAHAGGHGPSHGGGIGRNAGITMAILGVMLALCAALVGGARTELIATMVDQSNTYQKYQAQRMKHRMMITQLATLHALSPSRKQLKHFQEELATVHSSSGKGDTEDTAELKTSIGLSTKALVEILEPRAEDELQLVTMTKRYSSETDAAEKWAEAYEPAVEAHSTAAEHFEWGQLAAEIGIVIASVALLLANRRAWYISLAFGSVCAATLAWTYATTYVATERAEEEVATTKAAYQKLRKEHNSEEEDIEIVAQLEKRAAEMKEALPAATATAPSPEPAPAHHD